MRLFRRSKNGVSLWEVVLVTVIAGTTAALAVPKVKMGIENRQAKQAVETLKSIHHAVRMYEADHGNFLDAGGQVIDLSDLQTSGYLGSAEYPYLRKAGSTDSNGYEYSISPATNAWAQARRYTTSTVEGDCDCGEDCPPQTVTNAIRTIQICKNPTKIRDVLGSSQNQAGLFSTLGISSCPAS